MRASLLLFTALLIGTVAPAVGQQVGVAAAVNQSAVGTPPSQKPRTMVLGARVIHDEKVETNANGLLQILLADGTSFTVGPNSSMSIDSFVYDPSANTAKVVATLAKGTFRFIGGRTSKTPDGATINTPVGTVGIRGGIGNFDFAGHGGTPPHIDMLFGDSITFNRGGHQIGRLYAAGYSLALGNGGGFNVIRTPPSWTAALQHLLSGFDRPGPRGSSGGTAKVIAAALDSAGGGRTIPAVQPAGSPLSTPSSIILATTEPPPLPPLNGGPNPQGVSAWDEINNSTLAGVTATYLGSWNMTLDTSQLPPGVEVDVPTASGQFALDYSFGRDNGQGTMTFSNPDDTVTVPVSPVTTGSGAAAFHGGYSILGNEGNFPVSATLTVDGGFTNTAQGVGHGVSGTMGLDVTATTGGQTVGVSAGGSFNGSLDHTSH